MINVYKSDTGQYVLVHPPSQTVIIAEDLDSGFSKIHTHIIENHPEHAPQLTQPFNHPQTPPDKPGPGPKWALIALIIIIPLLWLATIHYAIGSILTDFQAQQHQATSQYEALEDQINQLRTQINAIGAKLRAAPQQTPPKPKPNIQKPQAPPAQPTPQGAQ